MSNTTKIADLQRFLSDGKWHLGSEISQAVSHRFSAAAYSAKQRGLYQLDKRWNPQHQQYEYKLIKASKKSVVGMDNRQVDKALNAAFQWMSSYMDGMFEQKHDRIAFWWQGWGDYQLRLLDRTEAIGTVITFIDEYLECRSLSQLKSLYKQMVEYVNLSSDEQKQKYGDCAFGCIQEVNYMPELSLAQIDSIWKLYQIGVRLKESAA